MSTPEVTFTTENHVATTNQPEEDTAAFCATYNLVMSGGLLGGMCVFGVLANILTLIVLPRFANRSKGSSPTTLLLGALAVSELFLLVLLFVVQAMPVYCPSPNALCDAYWSIHMYLVVWCWPCVSVFSMLISYIVVLTTTHRYIVVCYPHRTKQLCTMSKTRKALALMVLFVFVYEIPIFIDDKLVSVTQDDNTTTLERVYTALGESDVYQYTYKTTMYYIFAFILPILINSVLTGLLVRELRRASRLRSAMTSAQDTASSAEDEITRTLIAVVIVYLCCQPWEPARRVVEAHAGGLPGCPSLNFYFQVLPSVFESIMASLNFILFCMFGSKFRLAFLHMFGGGKKKNDGQPALNSGRDSSTDFSSLSNIHSEFQSNALGQTDESGRITDGNGDP